MQRISEEPLQICSPNKLTVTLTALVSSRCIECLKITPSEKQNYVSFLFEELTVTGDTFLAMMQSIDLRRVPVGTVSHLCAPPKFVPRVRVFLDREFPDSWIGRGGTFPGPLHLPILLL
jgi:hypothetical protein